MNGLAATCINLPTKQREEARSEKALYESRSLAAVILRIEEPMKDRMGASRTLWEAKMAATMMT